MFALGFILGGVTVVTALLWIGYRLIRSAIRGY